MKKIFTLLFFLVVSTTILFGQQPCGTIFDETAQEKFFSIPYTLRTNNTNSEVRYEIPIQVFMFRLNANNIVFPKSSFDIALCELNDAFDSLNIYFYLSDSVQYITDPAAGIVANFADARNMASTYNVPNRVNVYIGDISGTGACGFAWYPGTGPRSNGQLNTEGGMFLSPGCIGRGSKTWAHEFGHYLFLPHPFDGTSRDPQGVNSERVTRNNNEVAPRLSSNCQNAGDGFCDTPADFLGFRFNCNTFNITQTDINGDLFQPNVNLIMGYASDFCMTSWSQEQIATMRFTIPNLRPYLLNQPAPAGRTKITQNTQLLLPADSVTLPHNNVQVTFKAVPNATRYLVQFNRSLNFNASIRFDTVVTDTTFLIASNRLLPNNRYHWRVQGINDSYVCGPFSNPRLLFTDVLLNTISFENITNSWQVRPTIIQQAIFKLQVITSNQLWPNQFSLYDMQGKLVYQTRLTDIANEMNVTEILLPHLDAGMYFVRLNNKDIYKSYKIVVQ